MVCKVFKFLRKTDNTFVYLNGDDKSDYQTILQLYVYWYNNDFAPFENLVNVSINDFTFLESFCPIDFYDETRKLVRQKIY